MIAIVGCGGGGGWLVQLLAKSTLTRDVLCIDGDSWEEKNLDRQFCTEEDLGQSKALTLSRKLDSGLWNAQYIAKGNEPYLNLLKLEDPLTIFVCVDNHPARVCCLELADERQKQLFGETTVILIGNEYETASAQVYKPNWLNGPLDPRVMFPELLTDTEGDPLTPPCSGEALVSSPQLALSNMLSATFGALLQRYWDELLPSFSVPDELRERFRDSLPIMFESTSSSIKTKTKKDFT